MLLIERIIMEISPQNRAPINWDLTRLKGDARQIVNIANKYGQDRIGVEIAKLAAKLERAIKDSTKESTASKTA